MRAGLRNVRIHDIRLQLRLASMSISRFTRRWENRRPPFTYRRRRSASSRTLPSKPGSLGHSGTKPGRHIDIDAAWESIRAQAGRDVRIHDIRHSFASRALALGEGLPIIGRLLGHRRVETTARYAHLARDSIRESAERIAVSIAADIL